MLNKKWIIILMVLVFAGGTMIVSCKHGSSEKRLDHFFAHVKKELELTGDQEKILETLKKEAMSHHETMSSAHHDIGERIITHLKDDTFTETNVKAVFTSHHEKKEEVMDEMLKGIVEFYNVLNPEQKERLIEKIQDIRKWHSF